MSSSFRTVTGSRNQAALTFVEADAIYVIESSALRAANVVRESRLRLRRPQACQPVRIPRAKSHRSGFPPGNSVIGRKNPVIQGSHRWVVAPDAVDRREHQSRSRRRYQ
jgi:hypothetical protein